jgi:hypothetical protein
MPTFAHAQELIQRGLFATALAGWLLDRAFEAGIDDAIPFYGQTFYLPDAVRWVLLHVMTRAQCCEHLSFFLRTCQCAFRFLAIFDQQYSKALGAWCEIDSISCT